MKSGKLASLNGFVPFQGTSSPWNADISGAPVEPNSANIIDVIVPPATTTYTLYSTNEFGRTTSKVTVTVR